MRMISIGVAAVSLLLCMYVPIVSEDKSGIDTPPTILKALEKAFAGSRIVEVKKEIEDGHTFWEAKVQSEADIRLKDDGTLLEYEQKIPSHFLPDAVKNSEALKGSTLLKIELVLTEGNVRFELRHRTSEGKEIEQVFDPSGKVLKSEAK